MTTNPNRSGSRAKSGESTGELDVVAGEQAGDPRQVRRWRIGWETRFGRRSALVAEEGLEAARRQDHQEPGGLVTGHPDSVDDAARQEYQSPWFGIDLVLTAPYGHPPAEHEVRLVLVSVDVRRRLVARRCLDVHDAELSPGVVGEREDRHPTVQHPETRFLAGSTDVGAGSALQ